MLKKDVWELFKTHAGGTIHDEWRFVGEEADELCGAIAQAAEEETQRQVEQYKDMAEAENRAARAHFDGMKRAEGEITGLRAQVAVIGEALESLTVFCDQKHVADKLWEANSISGGTIGELKILLSSADKALSAAPKVAWSGKANLYHYEDLPEYGYRHFTMLDIEGDQVPICEGWIEQDGQQVEVFIVKCP